MTTCDEGRPCAICNGLMVADGDVYRCKCGYETRDFWNKNLLYGHDDYHRGVTDTLNKLEIYLPGLNWEELRRIVSGNV